jgi:hypothetical protein
VLYTHPTRGAGEVCHMRGSTQPDSGDNGQDGKLKMTVKRGQSGLASPGREFYGIVLTAFADFVSNSNAPI